MSTRQGQPKHQNKYAWIPQANVKKNETELGGRQKPYSEITGVCPRCKDQIEWKRKYGKYRPLIEPAKCQKCTKRKVRQAHHNLCYDCAKEHNVCAKCSCHVARKVGRDLSELETEQKQLEEAIKNARERDRRSLIRAMNKGKSASKIIDSDDNEAEELPSAAVNEAVESSEDDDEDAEVGELKNQVGKDNDVGKLVASLSINEAAKLCEDEDEDEDEDDEEDADQVLKLKSDE